MSLNELKYNRQLSECDLIFSAFKAQNQTASQREEGTHNQGLKKRKKKSRTTLLFTI